MVYDRDVVGMDKETRGASRIRKVISRQSKSKVKFENKVGSPSRKICEWRAK
jgi:hypothetical protein